MKQGKARFDFFLDQLTVLFAKAEKQKNPGLWLYKNNVRTPLFMLEGLAKMYSDLHNKKKFTKLKELFKQLEDVLGAIDYYDAFANEFVSTESAPPLVTNYLKAQAREKIQSMNEILQEHEWIGSNNKRINKIKEKLEEADWLKPEKEIKEIKDFYGKAIYEIVEFTQATQFKFNNVESEVHELRRKLRWLSIYPQALGGCIQLSKQKALPDTLKKYLTKEIISSPFNKLPDAGSNEDFLLLDQNYFYALSWMIAELGKLKDSGLRVIAIKEAQQQSGGDTEARALEIAYGYLGKKQPTLEMILKNAGAICKTYFDEKNLEYLVLNTSSIK
jgi:hypothetical protein